MVALTLTVVLGFAVGTWFGVNLAIGTGFVDKITDRVGQQIMNEHRAYRLAFAEQVGSAAEADRLMTDYREAEDL